MVAGEKRRREEKVKAKEKTKRKKYELKEAFYSVDGNKLIYQIRINDVNERFCESLYFQEKFDSKQTSHCQNLHMFNEA